MGQRFWDNYLLAPFPIWWRSSRIKFFHCSSSSRCTATEPLHHVLSNLFPMTNFWMKNYFQCVFILMEKHGVTHQCSCPIMPPENKLPISKCFPILMTLFWAWILKQQKSFEEKKWENYSNFLRVFSTSNMINYCVRETYRCEEKKHNVKMWISGANGPNSSESIETVSCKNILCIKCMLEIASIFRFHKH